VASGLEALMTSMARGWVQQVEIFRNMNWIGEKYFQIDPKTGGISRAATRRLRWRWRSLASSSASPNGDSRISRTRLLFSRKRSAWGWSGLSQWESMRRRASGFFQSRRPYSKRAMSR
jgi:hypothetical protein